MPPAISNPGIPVLTFIFPGMATRTALSAENMTVSAGGHASTGRNTSGSSAWSLEPEMSPQNASAKASEKLRKSFGEASQRLQKGLGEAPGDAFPHLLAVFCAS